MTKQPLSRLPLVFRDHFSCSVCQTTFETTLFLPRFSILSLSPKVDSQCFTVRVLVAWCYSIIMCMSTIAALERIRATEPRSQLIAHDRQTFTSMRDASFASIWLRLSANSSFSVYQSPFRGIKYQGKEMHEYSIIPLESLTYCCKLLIPGETPMLFMVLLRFLT